MREPEIKNQIEINRKMRIIRFLHYGYEPLDWAPPQGCSGPFKSDRVILYLYSKLPALKYFFDFHWTAFLKYRLGFNLIHLRFADHLGRHLSDYITRFNGLVKLYRNDRREGLIRARSIGAQKSEAKPNRILVYLDAHCEVGYNWLPPLIMPIIKNRFLLLFLRFCDNIWTFDLTVDHISLTVSFIICVCCLYYTLILVLILMYVVPSIPT